MKNICLHSFPLKDIQYLIYFFFSYWPLMLANPLYASALISSSKPRPASSFLTFWSFIRTECNLHSVMAEYYLNLLTLLPFIRSTASSVLLLLGIPPLVAFRTSVTFILFEGFCFLFKPSYLISDSGPSISSYPLFDSILVI